MATTPDLTDRIIQDGYEPNEYPPSTVKNAMGRLYRPVVREAADGTIRVEYRPVIYSGRTQENLIQDKLAASEKRQDVYDPNYGWIVEGYKLAKDRDVESIMAEVRS